MHLCIYASYDQIKTDDFELLAGALQDDTHAPYIFVIVLENIMRKTVGFKLRKGRSRRIGPKIVTDLDFADDIALVTSEIVHAQELLTLLEK